MVSQTTSSASTSHIVVLAASRATEEAQEREDWGHGALTKIILEGPRNWKADPYNGG
jgi:hypothetical protein